MVPLVLVPFTFLATGQEGFLQIYQPPPLVIVHVLTLMFTYYFIMDIAFSQQNPYYLRSVIDPSMRALFLKCIISQ